MKSLIISIILIRLILIDHQIVELIVQHFQISNCSSIKLIDYFAMYITRWDHWDRSDQTHREMRGLLFLVLTNEVSFRSAQF